MNKIILLVITIFFFGSCETNTNTNFDNLAAKDSSITDNDDSVTFSLRPLSGFIEDNVAIKKVQDTLLSYSEIKNILADKSDTTVDVDLYAFGGVEKMNKSGNYVRSTFSKKDFVVWLWAHNGEKRKEIIHGTFHFNLNTLNFYVIDSVGEQMTMKTWCKKQHAKE